MLNYRIILLFCLFLGQTIVSMNAQPLQDTERAYKRFISEGIARLNGEELHGPNKAQFLRNLVLWVNHIEENDDANLFSNLEKNSLRAMLLIKRRPSLLHHGVMTADGIIQSSRQCQLNFNNFLLTPNTYQDDKKNKTNKLINHAHIWWGQLSIKVTQDDFPAAWEHLERVKTPPYTRTAKLWQAHLILKNEFSPNGNRGQDLAKARELLESVESQPGNAAPHALLAALNNQGQHAPHFNPILAPNQPAIEVPLEPALGLVAVNAAVPAPIVSSKLVHPNFLYAPENKHMKAELWHELRNQENEEAISHQNDNIPGHDDDDSDGGQDMNGPHGHDGNDTDSNSSSENDSENDDDMMDAPTQTACMVASCSIKARDQEIIAIYNSQPEKLRTYKKIADLYNERHKDTPIASRTCAKVIQRAGLVVVKRRIPLTEEKVDLISQEINELSKNSDGFYSFLSKKHGVTRRMIANIASGADVLHKNSDKATKRILVENSFRELDSEAQKQPVQRLADKLGYCRKFISKTLNQAGLWTRMNKANNLDVINKIMAEFEDLSEEEQATPIQVIADRLDIHRDIVSGVLHEKKLRLKKVKGKMEENTEIIQRIKEEFALQSDRGNQRGIVTRIAKSLGINDLVVSNVLAKEGLRQKLNGKTKIEDKPEIRGKVILAFNSLSSKEQNNPIMPIARQNQLQRSIVSSILQKEGLYQVTSKKDDPKIIKYITDTYDKLKEESHEIPAVTSIQKETGYSTSLIRQILDKEGYPRKLQKRSQFSKSSDEPSAKRHKANE